MTIPADSIAVAAATVNTRSTDETRALGAAMAAVACPGDRIALVGPLGAGKTQFAKGFAVGLGVSEIVNSPSFTLMTEYVGRLPLFHQDLYRLSGPEEAIAGGLVDDRQLEGVTLSEWAERLPAEIDPERITVSIEVMDDEERRVTVTTSREGQARYVEAALNWARTSARAE
jgi:tRNA threonylcarbamoyladenosine biosynthesis protein TsaE